MNLTLENYSRVKQIIKEWIISINNDEILPNDINALNFGLYEPYSMDLIGSKIYDPEDDDWACEEDFVPTQRECPDFEVDANIEWEEFLDDIIQILNEIIKELKDIKLFKVQHITTGFCDGDLIQIK